MSVGRDRDLPGALLALAAVVFIAAFAFCVIAYAWDFHRTLTGPGTAASLAGMVASVVALHLRGDRP